MTLIIMVYVCMRTALGDGQAVQYEQHKYHWVKTTDFIAQDREDHNILDIVI